MKKIKQTPVGELGLTKSVQDKNECDYTIAAASKIETAINAFAKHGDLNTFQANKIYGDTCLHSTVSDIRRKTGIVLNRKSERVINRYGKAVTVSRYWLPDVEKAKQAVRQLKRARGVKGVL